MNVEFTQCKLLVTPVPQEVNLNKFWRIFMQVHDEFVLLVDLPPSPRIFDKNHDILGFEFTFSIILITF